MIARIDVDPEYNRAMPTGDSTYTINVKPGQEICDEQSIEVNVSRHNYNTRIVKNV